MRKFTRFTAFVMTMALLLCSFVLPTASVTAAGGTEPMVIDTVTVSLPGVNGYIQHTEKLTELVGSNGADGKGYVNVIVDDGSAAQTQALGYFKVMLVGKSDATQLIDRGGDPSKAIVWAIRHDAGQGGRICPPAQNDANKYGDPADFAAAGFRFAFSQDASNVAMIRGIGEGALSSVDEYTDNARFNTTALTSIAGDNGETAADGVYLRIHTGCSSSVLPVTITVAYPKPADYDASADPKSHWAVGGGSTIVSATSQVVGESTPTATPVATESPAPTATPTGPVNLVSEDLFASKTNAQEWFGGTLPGTFTEEDGEYVYKATTALNGIYTTHALPDGSFTVKMNIKPSEFVNGQNAQAYSGMGILLGRSAGGNAVPWTNIRFDADYATKKMQFYVWEKTADNRDIVAKKYGTDWYEGTFPEDMWFEVIMEFTSTGTKIYLDGYEVPQMTDGYTPPADSLGHFPTADEIKFIGLFPSGAEYSVKNFEVYEGVGLQLGALAPVATPTPSAPSATPGAQNKPTGDSSMMLIVMAIAICAGGAIVFAKKKSHAE